MKTSYMNQDVLELPGAVELGSEEAKDINGGAISPFWWALIFDAVNNFGDIREGVSDGFNGKPPRY
jgi:hypothetical protein